VEGANQKFSDMSKEATFLTVVHTTVDRVTEVYTVEQVYEEFLKKLKKEHTTSVFSPNVDHVDDNHGFLITQEGGCIDIFKGKGKGINQELLTAWESRDGDMSIEHFLKIVFPDL